MRRSGFTIMKKLIGFIKPMVNIMTLAIFTGVLGFLASIFITILGGFALINILGYETFITLKWIFILIGFFAIIRGILRYVEQLSNHYIAFKLLALIRNKVFTALRKLSPAKLEGKDKGNLISLITTDIELLEVFYAHTISPISIAAITSLFMTIFIGSYNWILGLIAGLAYITIGFIIPIISSKIGVSDGLEFRNKFGDMNSFLLDNLRGFNEIIQYNMGDKRLSMLNKKTDKLTEKQKKLKFYESVTSAISDASLLTFSAIMLFASIFLNQKGLIGFEGVLISTIGMMSSFGPVLALSNLSGNLRHTLASGDRVLDLLKEDPVVEEKIEGKEVQFSGANLSKVNFSYEDDLILDDYSIDIGKNNIIGIHGKSGSGKSTLLKLLMRFWDVNSGKVNISDENIKDIKTQSLRDIQSYITQETHLFNDTIKNNIGIGKKNASFEDIVKAAKKASIHDFIVTLPKGYDTEVGELGGSISSGEKQRIGIARAFLHDSPFILLDEPTSNLDSLNEGIILKSLKEESNHKTMFLVSHRKSTMNIADKVYKVDTTRVS